MIFDMSKKYKTKAGHKVTLLALNISNTKYPVKFEYLSGCGEWLVCNCTIEGKYYDNGADCSYDLVEDTTMQIEIGKKYKTKGGDEVKLYEIVSDQTHCVMGAIKERTTGNWVSINWTITGSYYDETDTTSFDLVEVEEIDWSKVPVDTKLKLFNDKYTYLRYFAGIGHNKDTIKLYSCGATSWSQEEDGDYEISLSKWNVEIVND
jgi:hypothetical protein